MVIEVNEIIGAVCKLAKVHRDDLMGLSHAPTVERARDIAHHAAYSLRDDLKTQDLCMLFNRSKGVFMTGVNNVYARKPGDRTDRLLRAVYQELGAPL